MTVRPWLPAAVVAGLLAASVGSARLAAIDAPGQRLVPGEPVAGVAELRERPQAGPFGASAEVAMVSGRARGSRLLARFGRDLRPPRRIGALIGLAGTFRRSEHRGGGFDFATHLRRRGIAGELAVVRLDETGSARSGVAGAIDGVRERAERAIAAGLPPRLAALGHGMVLGDDDAVPDGVREDFRDAGLGHLLSARRLGQNTAKADYGHVDLRSVRARAHRQVRCEGNRLRVRRQGHVSVRPIAVGAPPGQREARGG